MTSTDRPNALACSRGLFCGLARLPSSLAARLVRRTAGRGFDAFRADSRGQVAIMFAAAFVPTTYGLAAAIDYSKLSVFKAHVQAAADAAALGATQAMVNGATTDAATAIGRKLFFANAPSHSAPAGYGDPGAFGAVSVQTSNFAATQTALVSYSGEPPTVFAKLLGQTFGVVNVKATAQATTGSSSGAQTYAGAGSIAGDPYVTGADGVFHDMICTTAPGTWYNVLSDAGIQVNASCDPSVAGPQWQVLSGFSVILNGHVISMSAPRPTSAGYGDAWFGQITIDGVYYPAVVGQHSYLGGAVQTKIVQTQWAYLGDNWVTITTPTYTIKISFDYQSFAAGDIRITAAGAGQCGVPGGILGGLLAGIWDANDTDYTMAEATSKGAPYYWPTCNPPAGPQTAHLIK